MVLATVPEALPTWKNQRATSWPAPISANVPYFLASRLICSAFWPVFNFSLLIVFSCAPRYTNQNSARCPSRRMRFGTFRDAGFCAILVSMFRTQDLHVKEIVPLLSPRALKALSPTTRGGERHRRAQPRAHHPHFAAGRPARCSSSSGRARFTTKKARWNTRRG